jgi:hypothetical protein
MPPHFSGQDSVSTLQESSQATKQRSGCLLWYLRVATFAFAVFTILYLALQFLRRGDLFSHPSLFAENCILIVIAGIAIYGMWRWKRWGIFLLIAILILQRLIGYPDDISAFITALIACLVPCGLLYSAVKDNWKDFD